MIRVKFGKINNQDKIYRYPETLTLSPEEEKYYVRAGKAEYLTQTNEEIESPEEDIIQKSSKNRKGRR